MRQVVRDLAVALPRVDEGGLRRAFLVWLRRVLLPGKGQEDIPELVDLEDFRAMLSETVERWNQELMKKGEKRGEKKGMAKGLEKGQRDLLLRQLTVKFGPVDDRTRARVEAAGPLLGDRKIIVACGPLLRRADYLGNHQLSIVNSLSTTNSRECVIRRFRGCASARERTAGPRVGRDPDPAASRTFASGPRRRVRFP